MEETKIRLEEGKRGIVLDGFQLQFDVDKHIEAAQEYYDNMVKNDALCINLIKNHGKKAYTAVEGLAAKGFAEDVLNIDEIFLLLKSIVTNCIMSAAQKQRNNKKGGEKNGKS